MDAQKVQQICEEYADSNNKAHDICKRYGVSPSKLTQIIMENGLQPRRPSRVGKKLNGGKGGRKCPKCRKFIAINGARYCPFCAADIRSEAELLIEQQEKLITLSHLLPQNVRDELQTTVLQTVAYLKKEC